MRDRKGHGRMGERQPRLLRQGHELFDRVQLTRVGTITGIELHVPAAGLLADDEWRMEGRCSTQRLHLCLTKSAAGLMGECEYYLHSTRPCELAWFSSALHASDQAGSSA